MSEEKRVLSNDEKMEMMNKQLGKTPVQKVEKKEEAPVEKPQEKPKEEIPESKPEEVPEKVEKVEEKQEEVKFDIELFNKTIGKELGKEFESDDAIKALFEKSEKYDGLKSEFDDTLQKLGEYKNLSEQLDPMANFANEDEYVRQQFLIKNKDKLDDGVIKALSTLSPSKVKDLSSEDALKLDLMVNSGLSSEEASAYLLKKYDIEDFNSEDLDVATKASIKVDVKNSKESLGKLYDGIKVPERTDYETARTQLRESWESPLTEIVKGIDKIEVAEGLSFVVTDDMKEGLDKEMMSLVMSGQLKPSEEAGAVIAGKIREKLLLNNIDKVVKSIEADVAERLNQENNKKYHNDKPFRDESRQSDGELDNDSKMQRLLNR